MSRDESLTLELADALRRQWWVAVLVAAAFTTGAAAYASRLPTQWTAASVVSFSPRPGNPIGGDTIRVVVPRFLALATAEATRAQVAKSTGIPEDELAGAIDASIAPDTANLSVSVTLGHPQDALDVVRAVTAEVVAFAADDRLLEGDVVAPPVLPATPSGPPRRLYVAAGAFLAVCLGALAALATERARPRVRRGRDLTALVPYPLVGRIPRTRFAGQLSAAITDPVVGASVRAMRTYLDSELRGDPLHVVGVTSAEPGAGKTTVAAAFAASVASLDVRVLLVDADLRRPRIAAALGVAAEPTLSDVLRGEVAWRDAVRPGPRKGLYVVPGELTDDSGDLVARRLGPLLAEMRREYEVIVVDCPPLLAIDDAATIATLVDGVLFVVPVGSGHAPVQEAATVLSRVNATVVGTVLNGDRSRIGAGGY